MKRPTFTGPKKLFQRTRGLVKTRLVKTGQESLNRISADMAKKEYPVFVEPIKRRLPSKFKYGFKRVLMPFSKPDGVAEAVGTSVPMPEPMSGDSFVTDELVDESRLIEEIFVRPAPAFDEPDEEPAISGEISPDSANDKDQEDDPLETDSESAAPSDNAQSRAAAAPLVRTMVEAIPDLPAGEGGLSEFLSEDLQDIFKSVDYTNPRTKALVRSREHVDVYELAKELDEYARSIGAVPPER